MSWKTAPHGVQEKNWEVTTEEDRIENTLARPRAQIEKKKDIILCVASRAKYARYHIVRAS